MGQMTEMHKSLNFQIKPSYNSFQSSISDWNMKQKTSRYKQENRNTGRKAFKETKSDIKII